MDEWQSLNSLKFYFFIPLRENYFAVNILNASGISLMGENGWIKFINTTIKFSILKKNKISFWFFTNLTSFETRQSLVLIFVYVLIEALSYMVQRAINNGFLQGFMTREIMLKGYNFFIYSLLRVLFFPLI